MMIPTLVSRAAKLAAASFLLMAAVTATHCQTTTNLLDRFNRNGALDLSSPDISDIDAPSTWTVPAGSAAFNTTNLNGGAWRITGAGCSWVNFAP